MKAFKIIDVHESDAYHGSEELVLKKVFTTTEVYLRKSAVGGDYVQIDDCLDKNRIPYTFYAVRIEELSDG